MKNVKLIMKNVALQRKRNALYFSLFIFSFSLLLFSCKKQVPTSPANSFESVKVYNDSTIFNPINLVAGTNKLVMFYNTLNLNSTLYGTGIMATDNNGNLLWNCSVHVDFYIANIGVQTDGSVILAGLILDASKYITRYYINTSGIVTSSDTICLPPNKTFLGLNSVDVLQSGNGNILLYGYYNSYPPDYTKSFVMECNPAGKIIWQNQYYFPVSKNSEGTAIQEGITTTDGGYLFFGIYSVTTNMLFLMKTDALGNTQWTKFYPAYGHTPFSIVPSENGNYFLCTTPNYTTSNTTGIYTISQSGDSLNYTQINNVKSTVSGSSALTSGGIYFLNNGTANTNTTLPYINQNTIFTELNNNLTVISQGNFQTEYPDYFSSACLTSDGDLACFGMIQSFGKSYFKPELIITKGQ
jgi:hypothetical protein